MHIAVVSLFPELVGQVGEYGVVGRAVERQLLSLHCENPRDFAKDVHRTVDDRPYGGGPGMVLKYEPTAKAIRQAKDSLPAGSPVICLSPQGKVFDQAAARRYADLQGFVLLAGRYEGIDERLIENEVDEELSLGDFVLSGGEIAAMAVIDAVAVERFEGRSAPRGVDDRLLARGVESVHDLAPEARPPPGVERNPLIARVTP